MAKFPQQLTSHSFTSKHSLRYEFYKSHNAQPSEHKRQNGCRGKGGVESVGSYKTCSRRTGTDCAFVEYLEIKLNIPYILFTTWGRKPNQSRVIYLWDDAQTVSEPDRKTALLWCYWRAIKDNEYDITSNCPWRSQWQHPSFSFFLSFIPSCPSLCVVARYDFIPSIRLSSSLKMLDNDYNAPTSYLLQGHTLTGKWISNS